VLAARPQTLTAPLLTAAQLTAARSGPVRFDTGRLLLDRDRRLRILASPADGAPGRVAVAAVRLGPRDEALRELLAQLAIANLGALAVASLVGYRLAGAALDPVDRYRAQADDIAAGATGVRLDVPTGTDDEITRLGHTLNRMLDAQDRAATAQRQFLADASHELRTPLAVITSQIELALRRPRSAGELGRTLADLGEDAARLSHLADQLLSLERAGARGASEDSRQLTRLGEALSTALGHTRSRLHDTGRQVSLDDGGLGDTATDERVTQVLTNLLDNAVTHGVGDIHVAATLGRPTAEPDRPLLRITVGDHGPGIPADFLPHTVDRFRRADPARTTSGTGLGLAIIHAHVVGLNGELRLCSAGHHHRYPPVRYPTAACDHPDDGTTATVLLPPP
jgi:signal transduction histidine kinase